MHMSLSVTTSTQKSRGDCFHIHYEFNSFLEKLLLPKELGWVENPVMLLKPFDSSISLSKLKSGCILFVINVIWVFSASSHLTLFCPRGHCDYKEGNPKDAKPGHKNET